MDEEHHDDADGGGVEGPDEAGTIAEDGVGQGQADGGHPEADASGGDDAEPGRDGWVEVHTGGPGARRQNRRPGASHSSVARAYLAPAQGPPCRRERIAAEPGRRGPAVLLPTRRPFYGLIEKTAEGGGVGEAVHEEVEGGEADEGPAQHRYAGNNEDGAGECEDAEEGVGAEVCGWVFGRTIGMERRDEVAMEPSGKAPGGRNGAGRQHEDEEGDQPGGGLDPGHHERESEGTRDDELVEAALGAIGHG